MSKKKIEEVKVKTLLNEFQNDIEPGDEEIDGLASLELEKLFEDVHPVNAAKIIRSITNGIDNGFTGQGSYHPDFQRVIHSIVKDPEDRFDNTEELTETYNIVTDEETYKKYHELKEEYGSLEDMLNELE
jgi:hypothetical protein